MPERVARVMCSACWGEGTIMRPQLAIARGSHEGFSVLAPTRCRDCQGGGWLEIIETLPDTGT